MSKPDGGPAFPVALMSTPNGEVYGGEFGMSLRDYFAAAALQSILRHRNNTFEPNDDAAWCYRVADAMLKESVK